MPAALVVAALPVGELTALDDADADALCATLGDDDEPAASVRCGRALVLLPEPEPEPVAGLAGEWFIGCLALRFCGEATARRFAGQL